MSLTSSQLQFTFVTSLLALVAGVVMLGLARRGRRVDIHPVCRRCGYDLVGLPRTSDRCPECGAELTGPKAIRVGNRRRRVGLGRVALLVLLLGVTTTGWSGYRLASTIEWIQYEPLGWLVKDVENAAAPRKLVAEAEILRRLRRGSISKSNLRWLIDRALDQEIATKRGGSVWRAFLDESFMRKRVEEAQEDRYIEHVKNLVADVVESQVVMTSGEVLSGRPITIQVSSLGMAMLRDVGMSKTLASGRAGPLLSVQSRIEIINATMDGVPATFFPGGGRQQFPIDHQVIVRPPWEALSDREGDMHDVIIYVQVEVTVEGQKGQKKSTMEVPIKRKVHVPGGVAADRTI